MPHCTVLQWSQNIKQMFGVGGPKFDQFETIPNNPQQYATAPANSGCFNTGEHLSTFQVNNELLLGICRNFLPLYQQEHERTLQSHQNMIGWNPEYQENQLCQDNKSKTAAHKQETQWKSSLEICDSPSTTKTNV